MSNAEVSNDDLIVNPQPDVTKGKNPEAQENPYASPEQAIPQTRSTIDAPAPDSVLAQRLKPSTGHDLILYALLATICAFFFSTYFLPFGFVLNIGSLALLLGVVLSRCKPSALWIVCGILIAIWSTLHLGLLLLGLLLAAV